MSSGGGFTKMYLVTEAEFNKLNKSGARRYYRTGSGGRGSLAMDELVLTNSLRAVNSRRKREAISGSVAPTRMSKYVKRGEAAGVPKMTDQQVAQPLPQPATAAAAARRRRQRAASPPPALAAATSVMRARAAQQQQQHKRTMSMSGEERFETPNITLQYFDVGGGTSSSTPTRVRAAAAVPPQLQAFDV